MPRQFAKRRVVVTGAGMVTPLGVGVEESFSRAALGLSGIGWIRSFPTEGLPCRVAGEVDDSRLPPLAGPEVRRLSKFFSRGLRLMVPAAEEALRQAGLEGTTALSRAGVALGSHGDNPAVGDVLLLNRYYSKSDGWDVRGLMKAFGYSPLNFFRRKPDVAAALLGEIFRCGGPVISVASACAAGAQAIGEAYKIVSEGGCPVMLAGGCESTVNFMGVLGFILLKALVERYPTPQQASRPFDRKRNGFVMSEGAGAVVMEDLDHAMSRGTRILGEILGYGESADAYRITDVHPAGVGAVFAMRGAVEDAGVEPGAVQYINAHGTSTQLNDITETMAIKEVFGPGAKEIPVSSNKSMLGHTIAAAGAIECIMTLTGMERSVVLPTINYDFPDPKCDLFYVPGKSLARPHSVALSNSFGFGGQNACLCLGRFEG